MEQVAWIAIGIISILIVMGVLINFSALHSEQERERALSNGLDSMAVMCDSICRSPEGAYRSVSAEIPQGTVIETDGQRICADLDDDLQCRNCPCGFQNETVLNLTDDVVESYFTSHEYECFFENLGGSLSLECRG